MTGVQTCALPIYPGTQLPLAAIEAHDSVFSRRPQLSPAQAALLTAFLALPIGVQNMLKRQAAAGKVDYITGANVISARPIKVGARYGRLGMDDDLTGANVAASGARDALTRALLAERASRLGMPAPEVTPEVTPMPEEPALIGFDANGDPIFASNDPFGSS